MKINSKNGLSKMQVTDVIYPCSRVAGSIGLCPQMKNPTFYVGMFICLKRVPLSLPRDPHVAALLWVTQILNDFSLRVTSFCCGGEP